ncbi:MAG: redoxin domain-containing protein [Desulfobacterales bacterium]|nr:redoxin domain-containing protein [Desulfobacterales bacterium]
MQLHHRRKEIEALNTKIFLIGFEPEERAREWMKTGGINFSFLLDLDRSVYRAYELKRSIFRSWHPRSLWFYARRSLRGEPIPRFRADPNQMGGDFVIDGNGYIRLAYYGKDATDRPSVDMLLSVLRTVNPSRNNV